MIHSSINNDFESWRRAARRFLAGSIPPDQILWTNEAQGTLFTPAKTRPQNEEHLVPAQFINLARAVACFDHDSKWSLLYRILFRLRTENRNLLQIESDADVSTAIRMEKAVNRDVHKFHAFVRFRKVELGSDEIYVAWHEPHHLTVERSVPFFVRRFGSMKFSILTPRGCAHWDRERLTFSDPASRATAPDKDETEDFWLLYYRSIFNPFRLKVNAMKKELPVRHWPTLPEAELILQLIREARAQESLEPAAASTTATETGR
jgi:probable DNA metabolism protein